jgi:glycosyltransferase involved in cell wall biosynthesis
MPAVSVIVPTYNRKAYVCEAVHSILQQSFTDLEAIVVVDGSTDATIEALGAIQDKRLRIIQQPNAGRSAARNNGIAQSSGEYISFLDDDDRFLPEKLAMQVQFLRENPAVDILGAGLRLVDAQGNPTGVLQPWEDQESLDLLSCLYSCPLIPSAVLLRRSSLSLLSGWFDPAMPPSEDKDFFVRLIAAGGRAGWLKELVADYRVHASNSQQDGQAYLRVRNLMYDKIFASPALAPEILAEKEKLYGASYLNAAFHCFATGQIDLAQVDLRRALDIYPPMLAGKPSYFASHLLDFSATFHVQDSQAYLKRFFDTLPSDLNSLRKYRRETFALYHMKAYFRKDQRSSLDAVHDLFRALCYDPFWITNKGVWALLVKRAMERSKPDGE